MSVSSSHCLHLSTDLPAYFSPVLFGGAGVLSYLAYGSEVQTVILVNLPSDQKFVQVVQFLYASAILLSTPLQLFPAVRIMENSFFKKAPSGKMSPKVKWEKNLFRASMVMVCYCVAWLGASDLDKFVSFIGSFAWYALFSLLSVLFWLTVFHSASPCATSIQPCCTIKRVLAHVGLKRKILH